MLSRGLLVLLLASPLGGCLAYEFDHELWLRVDGSGTVNVTGRPELARPLPGMERHAVPRAERPSHRAWLEAARPQVVVAEA